LFLLFLTGIVSAAQTARETVEIVAVGDILLARGVERQIEKFGADYPFGNVKNILENADLAIGNLENPLTVECEKAEKKFSFQAKPETAKILAENGFDILSLANNHSLDCGRAGLLETIENLKKENLLWSGAGKTEAETVSPVFVEIKKIKIAFLSFTAILPAKQSEKSSNVAFAAAEKIARTVSAARRLSDVVVVSVHWGTEYASRPNEAQIELADAAIKAGADFNCDRRLEV
jgi:poly-gamma-glutamate synthesis protein (capsule biosynthesis protein)